MGLGFNISLDVYWFQYNQHYVDGVTVWHLAPLTNTSGSALLVSMNKVLTILQHAPASLHGSTDSISSFVGQNYFCRSGLIQWNDTDCIFWSVSATCGSPCQHIWTFVVACEEQLPIACPCVTGSTAIFLQLWVRAAFVRTGLTQIIGGGKWWLPHLFCWFSTTFNQIWVISAVMYQRVGRLSM